MPSPLQGLLVVTATAALSCVVGAISLQNDNLCGSATCFPCTDVKIDNGGGCGWCLSTKTCLFGTASGPINPSACPDTEWSWWNSTCPGQAPTPQPTPMPPATPRPEEFVPPHIHAEPWWTDGANFRRDSFRNETVGPIAETPLIRWNASHVNQSEGRWLYQAAPKVANGVVLITKCIKNANWEPIMSLVSLDAITGRVISEIVMFHGTDEQRCGSETEFQVDFLDFTNSTDYHFYARYARSGWDRQWILKGKVYPEGQIDLVWSMNVSAVSWGGTKLVMMDRVVMWFSKPTNFRTKRWIGLDADTGKVVLNTTALEHDIHNQLTVLSSEVLLAKSSQAIYAMYPEFKTVVWKATPQAGSTTSWYFSSNAIALSDGVSFLAVETNVDAMKSDVPPPPPPPGYPAAITRFENTGTEAKTVFCSKLNHSVAVFASDGDVIVTGSQPASTDTNPVVHMYNATTGAAINVTFEGSGWLSKDILLTKDYVIVSGATLNAEGMWREGARIWHRGNGTVATTAWMDPGRAGGQLLMAYQGGWLYVTTGHTIRAAQLAV